jgi:uroporphyrinogen III methyltransferase/synthase
VSDAAAAAGVPPQVMHPVALVGAGPGNPGLLTVRAVECLSRADLVLYDRLVPKRLLDCVPPSARKVCVEAVHGPAPVRYPEVHHDLIDAARRGLRVVRLKGGDPFVFGRGGEEVEELRRAGVPFEVVPGVTAALGAAAFACIPLTDRRHASGVAFVTGHQKSDSELDWSALARFPGTLVVYMGVARLASIAQQLLRHGKPPDTPAAIVRWATTADQQTLTTTLGGLADTVQAIGVAPPAVVIVGPVVSLRQGPSWFESLPLFGRHVLITRPRDQAGAMCRRLEELGASVHLMPAVTIGGPPDWGPVDQALANLDCYDWLVFTSANGVNLFLRRLLDRGRDTRALGKLRLAAIGPATSEALRAHLLEPDLMPPVYTSEGLAAALEDIVAGRRVLLARADRGRPVLREQLAAVATVDQVTVYSQSDAPDFDPDVLRQLRDGPIDHVTLTSSNIARAFAAALDGPTRDRILTDRLRLVTISPVTSAAVRELGLPVAAEAIEATTPGVVAALVALAATG